MTFYSYTSDQVRVSSVCANLQKGRIIYGMVMPFRVSVRPTPRPGLCPSASPTCSDIELKFCIHVLLCFNVPKIKFENGHFDSIFE